MLNISTIQLSIIGISIKLFSEFKEENNIDKNIAIKFNNDYSMEIYYSGDLQKFAIDNNILENDSYTTQEQYYRDFERNYAFYKEECYKEFLKIEKKFEDFIFNIYKKYFNLY